MNKWDRYFHNLCKHVSAKSPCLSRKIGAILVRDHSIISTGYNGPPRKIPHCGSERFVKDNTLKSISEIKEFEELNLRAQVKNTCPRQILGYESGTHMELCPAQHAEENAVSNAARNGVSVFKTTLYMNSVTPCQKCFGTLINAGIKEIVIEEIKLYDVYTEFLINNSDIEIREFNL